MSDTNKNPVTPACDLGAHLESRDAALVTLVAGELQIAVHRSILVANSPVFAAMLAHDMVEASSGRIVISDIEPKVVQQLLLFMYNGCAPQICSMATQLLVAADKYCMPDLKEQCELQLVQHLSVQNVMTNALFALRYPCTRLKESCVVFIQGNLTQVIGTDGWAEVVSNHPEEFLEVSHLVAANTAKTRIKSQEQMDQELIKAAKNEPKKVRELLVSGADVGARDVTGRTALHYAAGSGYEKATTCLLQAGARVEARDTCLQTPLHYAAMQGYSPSVVQSLLTFCGYVNYLDLYGDTPLHLAAWCGDKNVVKALLDGGADKRARNDRAETPLRVAERCQKEHLLAMLSVSDSASISETNKNQNTLPLDFVGAILETGDEAVITLEAGETQLAVHRQVLVAKSAEFAAMLDYNTVKANSGPIIIADVEPTVLKQLVVFMYQGRAPQLSSMAPQLLVVADKYSVPDLKAQCEMELIRNLSVENLMRSALLALQHSCPHLKEAAGCFLQANFSNVVGTEGWAYTVRSHPKEFVEITRLLTGVRSTTQKHMDQKLLKVAEEGDYGEVPKLLATGAYVGARDMRGRTALHLASSGKDWKFEYVLSNLLEAGAALESRDMGGRTALHYAAAKQYEVPTGVLLKAGARVEAKDRWLQTALHFAIQENCLDTVKQLVAASSDVNTADVYGDTPLHLAARRGRTDVVKLLLEKGANKGARNNRKETPVDIAGRFKGEDLLAMLR